MQKTKIDWPWKPLYTWNPVSGCLNGCNYCYARRIAVRFNGHFKPTFYPDRISEPQKIKKSSFIFVCSMADLFGDWVDDLWIENVLAAILENPRHTFLLLTKNPKRYLEFECLTNTKHPFFLKNVWCGITIDVVNQARLNYLKQLPKEIHKFVSFEPLLGEMSALDLSGIDLCIVGADTSPEAKSPKEEWISSINHPNLFIKNNIKKYINE